jgi:predicted ester cyclase
MDNVEIVRTVEDLWNSNKLDELDQYFAPDFSNASGVPMLPKGLAGAKMAHQASMAAFPDRNVDVLDAFGSADGNRVVVRARLTGTNQGGAPWLGVGEGNGKQVDFEFIGIYELSGGKIVGHWGVNDGLMAAIQVGGLTPLM